MRRGMGDDPRLERDANELHAALGELLRVYHFRDRERICRHDVSVSQGHALEVLEALTVHLVSDVREILATALEPAAAPVAGTAPSAA